MYSLMTVANLKIELKKRNASLTGKKADLVARLETYDKNFGVNDDGLAEYLESEQSMVVPADGLYKDINASTKLPPFTRHHIQSFSERYSKNIKYALQMYESRHLVTARVAELGSYTFFRGQCKASMKKIMYVVDLKICCAENACTVEESHCECAAGNGLEAHCKHVLVLMLGIENMVRHKCINLYQTCTQQLMVFKRPKPFYASPMECHKIGKRRKEINFNPIKNEDIPISYNDYVKNLVVNFGPTTAPIKQTIPPANTYAIEWDHSFYCKMTGEEHMLQNLLLKDVTKEKIIDIEKNTRLQSKCEEWKDIRKTHITASVYYNVCHCKPINKKHLAEKIMEPNSFHSQATMYGQVQEPYAIKKFEDTHDVQITKCGLFLSESHPFLGASPDGLLNDDCVIEVKCPYSARYRNITTTSVPYLEVINAELSLKKRHPYYTQIQGQLFCTKDNMVF